MYDAEYTATDWDMHLHFARKELLLYIYEIASTRCSYLPSRLLATFRRSFVTVSPQGPAACS